MQKQALCVCRAVGRLLTDSVGSILNAEVCWAFYKNAEQESQNGGVAGKFPPTQQYLSVCLHMCRPGLF